VTLSETIFNSYPRSGIPKAHKTIHAETLDKPSDASQAAREFAATCTGWAKKTKPHTFVHIFAKY